MERVNDAAGSAPVCGAVTAAEARLIQQLRQGDADAGYQFMRDYYPGIYRYLLFLTGRPETGVWTRWRSTPTPSAAGRSSSRRNATPTR